MNYLVEGCRNVGKTFLINSLNKSWKYNSYKFEFPEFQNNYTYIGRDLAILDLIKKNLLRDIILDRGILSTLVFGNYFKRYDEKIENNLINLLNYDLENKLKIIYVYGKNPIKRIEKDNFDFLEKEYFKINKLYNYYIDKIKNIEIVKFKNNFNEKSINKFAGLFGK